MNGLGFDLNEVKEVDPKLATRIQRLRFASAGLVLSVAILFGAIIYGEVQQAHESERITKVEQSACQVNPKGYECQQTKREASRDASVGTTCISFRIAGYPCPKPGSAVAKRIARGVVTTSGHSPSSQPSPPSGGHSGGQTNSGENVPHVGHGTKPSPTPPKSGSGTAPEPPTPGASPTPAPPNTATPAPSAPETTPVATETPPTAPIHSTLEGVKETVGGILETVHGATCPLLRSC